MLNKEFGRDSGGTAAAAEGKPRLLKFLQLKLFPAWNMNCSSACAFTV